ncbi:MAG: chemotaxis protein CheA [Pirellulales bacterium]|nr:chemotaxis protein CheA [Pirellulales bacterium]
MSANLPADEMFEALLGDFLDESSQLLDRLNENLLQLDAWARQLDEGQRAICDAELLNEMFRAAHSFKGLSAMLGLSEINELTHRVENVFDAARRAELYLTSDSVELLFQAVDCLVGLVACLKETDRPAVDTAPVVGQIQQLLQQAGAERQPTNQADAERALTADLPPVAAETAVPRVSSTPAAPLVDYFVDISDERDVPAKYLSIFIDETDLALDSLTETLLDIEGAEGQAARETLLVVSHRIKGSAAAVGLNRPAKLAHFMEDVLQQLREQKGTLSPELADALLRCTDGLRVYVQGLRQGQPESNSFNQLAHELCAAQSSKPAAPARVASTQVARGDDAAAAVELSNVQERLADIAAMAPPHSPTAVGCVTFASDFNLSALKAQLLLQKLLQFGTLYYCEPSADALDALDSVHHLFFGLQTNDSRETIAARLRIGGVQDVVIESSRPEPAAEPVAPSPAPPSTGARIEVPAATASTATAPAETAPAPASLRPAAPATPKSKPDTAENRPTETLRVDIERLDQLMNLAGQLVINKARFTQIGEGLRGVSSGKQAQQLFGNLGLLLDRLVELQPGSDPREAQRELESLTTLARRMQADLGTARDELDRFSGVRASINELFESVHQLDRISDGIQKTVMDTRMVPIGPLFGRFRRVIRDLTRTNGKQIELDIRGEKTELDKRMIDELGDPLIHMVRNSADHGIESPEDRRAAGKPAQGTIVLDAFHRGNSIIIQVVDDGRGLNTERIRQKAIEKNLVAAADAERLTPHQVHQLIWEPGFSTADKVTEVSGRGMGMDIVKSKIEDLNGTVDLESVPGQGTTFTIKLPLTLAILPSLMSEIDGDVFALPMESVVEIVRVKPAEQWTVHGQQTANVRGRVISVVRLSDVFTWNDPAAVKAASDDLTLVILGLDGRELGLVVDRVLGEEDIVIKSLAENYENVIGIAGASILGNGRVSLILDIGAVITMASRRVAAN